MWCKHTNFETSTRIPFILVDPRTKTQGQRTNARVELIDMYPTIVGIAGIAPPNGLDGKSLVTLINNPKAWDTQDTVAFSQFHRAGNQGYSVRTKDFRYTEWRNAKTQKIVAQELYDHRNDPGEFTNLAQNPEYASIIAEHRKSLPQTEVLPAGTSEWKPDKLDRRIEKWIKNDSIPDWLK